MAETFGSKVIHAVLTQSAFSSLASKSSDTLYFVTNSSAGIKLYKGDIMVGGGFQVLTAPPADTTGMAEGVLYLAVEPGGDYSMYYKDGNSVKRAMTLVHTSASGAGSSGGANWIPGIADAENATGNDNMVPSVAALYQAISTKIAEAMAGLPHNNILAPVANISALRAVTDMEDKDVIFVEDVNSIYSYDAQGTGTDDGRTVITPTGGTGRWFLTQAGFTYDSTDFKWTSNGLALQVPVTSIYSSASTTASGLVSAHNVDSSAHSELFTAVNNAIGGKMDAPATAGADGDMLYYDSATQKPVWGAPPDPSTAISAAVSAHNVDSTAHSNQFSLKADLNDIKWITIS